MLLDVLDDDRLGNNVNNLSIGSDNLKEGEKWKRRKERKKKEKKTKKKE